MPDKNNKDNKVIFNRVHPVKCLPFEMRSIFLLGEAIFNRVKKALSGTVILPYGASITPIRSPKDRGRLFLPTPVQSFFLTGQAGRHNGPPIHSFVATGQAGRFLSLPRVINRFYSDCELSIRIYYTGSSPKATSSMALSAGAVHSIPAESTIYSMILKYMGRNYFCIMAI